jgi:hypothetical protein
MAVIFILVGSFLAFCSIDSTPAESDGSAPQPAYEYVTRSGAHPDRLARNRRAGVK